MTDLPKGAGGHLRIGTAIICFSFLLGACSLMGGKGSSAVAGPLPDPGIEDLRRIPQKFAELSRSAGDRISIGAACRDQLFHEFQRLFFRPWTSSVPLFDPAESREFIRSEGRAAWYGVNKRRVPPSRLQELVDNCDLDRFPSRSDTAIAVAPGHLRGLPTPLPLYESADAEPFDMLSYPQVKLNEPLRVLHVSRDGVWLFVETGYSNGWMEARDVALVDAAFIEWWMQAPHLVIVRDYAPVPDGRGVGAFPCKIGTILPLAGEGEGCREVAVASAGEGGQAEMRSSLLPASAAAPFPLEFNERNVALLGDQLLGQPYGWGEIYGLRDCSALLRDFFLPFGIWMPRASVDQIASIDKRLQIAELAPLEKEELIRSRALPFLTLLYKPGHIVLYAGVDREGRPLVFHNAWSIRVKDGAGQRTQIVGISAITTLEPGKELGLVGGASLLERVTELATVTERCMQMPESSEK